MSLLNPPKVYPTFAKILKYEDVNAEQKNRGCAQATASDVAKSHGWKDEYPFLSIISDFYCLNQYNELGDLKCILHPTLQIL